ncbi:hypothetical protein [Nocardioides sp. SYSU D00038]|uniref:hypothetical protein n=1 Tax=Nocardioides sp. SYSU D00038 TaxID=2812554 RepID=UPI0027DDAA44|nr:hypothetical protein [Nocardioides sp. SYSU D00038]
MPTSPETLEDQRLYTSARLTEVECLDCLARVAVKKNSEHHTSIQWNEEALGHCPEFSRMDRRPEGRPVHAACPRLVASIDAAAGEGRIPIGAEDGY